MEDFATFCKTEKHNKAIELQNSVTTQTGFIVKGPGINLRLPGGIVFS